MSIDWTPELTLNEELLDQQHVDLFRKMEACVRSLDAPRETLGGAVAALSDALLAHVAFEEQLMAESSYPERTRHKAAHELFVADFERMRAELRAQGPTPLVADWLRTRIPEWLRFHIRVNDQPFALWLARRRSEGGSGARRKDDGRRLS